ncbi:MAG: imelysin family protein [Maritimibacter sp.]|nr:imelysin family protein [Maritimibacter sp.]
MTSPRILTALATSAVLLTGGISAPAPATAQTVTGDIDHAPVRDRSLGVLERQFGAFHDATMALTEAARGYCAGEIEHDAYLDAFGATWRAWAPLEAYQFGPVEQQAASLTVAFWPDKKDFVGRGLEALLALPADSLADPATIAQGSAAAQGLPAIERLMYSDMPECPAVIGISAHLDGVAAALYEGWFGPEGWADLVRAAGPDNPVYLSDAEFTKALYTAIDFVLERIADARLGRPLGTFDAPQPTQAEAWRSGLSLDIVDAQLAGVADLLENGFAGGVFNPARVWVLGVIDDTRARVADIGAPLDVAVADPVTRFRVEGLQTKVRYLLLQFDTEIGPGLGVETGFSPSDGD